MRKLFFVEWRDNILLNVGRALCVAAVFATVLGISWCLANVEPPWVVPAIIVAIVLVAISKPRRGSVSKTHPRYIEAGKYEQRE